jgi:hypothetical protein
MGAQSSQVVLLEERANRLGEFLSLSLEDRHALPRSHLALRNIRHRVYAHFEVATDWRRRTGAVSEGNSRNHLLTRVASNKTQVSVVHLRQLGVCMFWRRRYLIVSQVNCLRY